MINRIELPGSVEIPEMQGLCVASWKDVILYSTGARGYEIEFTNGKRVRLIAEHDPFVSVFMQWAKEE